MNGNVYLHIVAKTGQLEMFRRILENDEIKNPRNDNGKTPFHSCCERGHVEVAKYLIKNGNELNINLDTKDKRDRTVFHMTCRKGQKCRNAQSEI